MRLQQRLRFRQAVSGTEVGVDHILDVDVRDLASGFRLPERFRRREAWRVQRRPQQEQPDVFAIVGFALVDLAEELAVRPHRAYPACASVPGDHDASPSSTSTWLHMVTADVTTTIPLAGACLDSTGHIVLPSKGSTMNASNLPCCMAFWT